ncbi:MAG: dipeptide epimerase, partial [Pirellulales bacterium]
MRVTSLTYHLVTLPLRKEIKHASHARRTSENILVRCRLADGTEGWGEGIPRPYVTDETPDGLFRQQAATPWPEQIDRDCTDWHDVVDVCRNIRPTVLEEDPRQCRSNAHRCAVELSLLDAYGRLFGEPVHAVARCFPPAHSVLASLTEVRYSGAVMAESRRKEAVSAIKMRLYGFAHCKVKVGLEGADDPARLRRIRRWLGRSMDVRIDANEAWHGSELVSRIEPLLDYRISCVEQPVPHAEVDALVDLRSALPVPVMLDESLTSVVDAERAIGRGTCDLFNIRLSKCGGFLDSLQLAAMAKAAGLGYQMGCHPGESGILSAAGRHFGTTVADI